MSNQKHQFILLKVQQEMMKLCPLKYVIFIIILDPPKFYTKFQAAGDGVGILEI